MAAPVTGIFFRFKPGHQVRIDFIAGRFLYGDRVVLGVCINAGKTQRADCAKELDYFFHDDGFRKVIVIGSKRSIDMCQEAM
jgi:hypothetical protein